MSLHPGPPGHARIIGRIPLAERPVRRIAEPKTLGTPDVAGPKQWADQAACRNADPELFFASDGEKLKPKASREAAAKAVCAGCRVRQACLDDALANRLSGIWGGTVDDERLVMLGKMRPAPKPRTVPA